MNSITSLAQRTQLSSALRAHFYSLILCMENDMDINRFEKTKLQYDNVPVYRKRWFVFLSFLFFIPATLLIALTGDIYAEKGGTVYKFKSNAIQHLIVTAAVFMVVGLLLASSR